LAWAIARFGIVDVFGDDAAKSVGFEEFELTEPRKAYKNHRRKSFHES